MLWDLWYDLLLYNISIWDISIIHRKFDSRKQKIFEPFLHEITENLNSSFAAHQAAIFSNLKCFYLLNYVDNFHHIFQPSGKTKNLLICYAWNSDALQKEELNDTIDMYGHFLDNKQAVFFLYETKIFGLVQRFFDDLCTTYKDFFKIFLPMIR